MLTVLPFVEMLTAPVAIRLELAGAPMLIVEPLVERLSAPVAESWDCAGAESTTELLLKPALTPPRAFMYTLRASKVPVEVKIVLAPPVVPAVKPWVWLV